VVVPALALGTGIGLVASHRRSPTPGLKRGVPFTLAAVVDGGPDLTLARAPGHPVVLNFFASWCVPCRRELPLLQRASSRVQVMGVAVADGQTPATRLLRQAGITYPTGADPDRRVSSQYRVVGMPTTYFIAPDGRVVGRKQGELRPAELERWLDRLERA
jgi:cytochrome c biogenesis protein CcmG/thiol:disulfide interchange protein DsbE